MLEIVGQKAEKEDYPLITLLSLCTHIRNVMLGTHIKLYNSCALNLKSTSRVDNSMGIDYGSWRWDGKRRAKGENWDNCNRITIKMT